MKTIAKIEDYGESLEVLHDGQLITLIYTNHVASDTDTIREEFVLTTAQAGILSLALQKALTEIKDRT